MKPDYQIKNVKLYNCDNMEFMKHIPDNYYDLAIVDPPYTDKINNETNHYSGDKRWKHRRKTTPKKCAYGKKPNTAYFNKLFRISKNQIIWGGNYFVLPISEAWIFWDKKNGDTYFADGELAWTSFKKKIKIFSYLWSGFRKEQPENRIHPTQKPVALYKWLLANYAECKKCDGLGYIDVPTIRMDCDVSTCPDCKGKKAKIFDSHGGSFSSACACLDMGFDFDGCEIDKEYFDNAVNRLKNNVQEYLEF